MAIDTFLGRLARAWRDGRAAREALDRFPPPLGRGTRIHGPIFQNMTIDIPMPAGVRTPGVRPPIFMADGRPVRFFAQNERGQWFVAELHDEEWRACCLPGGCD